MKEEILKKYFEDKMRQIDIAIELGISKYKISRIVTNDIRYKEEKENRKKQNKEKHIENTKKYMAIIRKKKSDSNGYAILKQLHEQASRELSGRKIISNRAFRDWNSSIYRYDNKSKSYILKKGITVTSDVPKRISWENI